MNNDNGKSYYGIGLDNSQLQADAAEASKILHGIDKEAERQSAAIRELLTNIPTINLDIVTNASTTLDTIDAAFAEIDRVFEANKYAIRELDKEYNRLSDEINKAFRVGDDKTYHELTQQRQAVKKVISARKEMNKEVSATADELAKEEQRLKTEAAEAEKVAQKHVSLRTRLREVKEQLIEMEAAGQRGTTAYRALQEEAARLTDSWNDAQAQAKILAHDQRGMQGIISGLQGITGAASIAQGAIGLFGGENEKLQQIMLRVQSLMAITMGLQQVQQMLNKDSAFSIVILNGLKELWNKLTGNSVTALEAENAAINTNTAATAADTAAQTTNNTSTVAGTAAQVSNTAATKTATTATVAQTVATKAASLAMRGLKTALIATGIGAFIVLVGELTNWLMSLFNATNKVDKEFNEQQEVLSKGREAYAKASIEVEDYKIRLEKFNGTKAQEKQLVKELNSKYGEALGYYDSLDKWKRVLVEKGEAYCQTLLKEAEAQATLNKYTEAFVHLQEVKDKAKKGDYDDRWYEFWNWGGKGDAEKRQEKIDEAETDMNKWLDMYKNTMNEAQNIKDNFNIGGHIDPSSVKAKSGSNNTDTFDPKKAALEIQKALDEYTKARKKYIKDANDEITNLIIDSQEQGLTRELNEIHRATRQKLEAWNEQLERLAEVRKATAKAQYMNTKDATEVGWANSADGKKTIKDWIAVIKAETPEIINEFDRVWNSITENGKQAIEKAQHKYTDALIEEFGTIEQREEMLFRQWSDKIKSIPPEFIDQAIKQMDEAFAKLNSDKFKSAINWETVFGDMSRQALPVLEFTLGKVRQYFEQNKASMSTQEIKDYQKAITNMENEIANRNPFTAFHKSLRDIGAAKTELVDALAAMKVSQEELNTAIKERNSILNEYNEILDRIESGELEDGSEEQVEAYERLTKAKKRVAEATERNAKAEQRVMMVQNRATASYKTFANNLKKVGGVINGMGSMAKELASIFSDDVADGIGEAIETIDEVLEATSSVIDAIGNVGKSVAGGIEEAVQASASGATVAAATGAAAISTIEKASVILAVISAALQVATAIANLLNNDDSKQDEIEKLQERIDQLQWELDNNETMRLRDTYGDAVERLREIYAATTQEIVKMHMSSEQYGNVWSRRLISLRHNSEIYEKTVERIADAYANVSYTADKALGEERYKESRKHIENLASQMLLMQKQIDKENEKKDKDKSKIEEYERNIKELSYNIANVVNSILEDIIGYSAENLSSELGNAFFDAAMAGENAMEAWSDKVNDIIADIIKHMLIVEYLEPKIGEIFDTYRNQWFTDGEFNGIESVLSSAEQMSEKLNEAGNTFSQIYDGLSSNLQDFFVGDNNRRRASERGIASASQDSVDELNGRATAIQGHTYNINENIRQMAYTTNLILQSVFNIENETNGFGEKIEKIDNNVKALKESISDITIRGIIIR